VKRLAIISAVLAISIISLVLFSDQFVTAKPQTKIHFTKTLESSPDPGIGQDAQFALVLSPNKGSIYRGSLTFASNEPVEIVVLHELDKQDVRGQSTWTADNNTIYGMTVVEPSVGRSFEFTGAALAFRSKVPFVVTASVDGWIRGQPTDLVLQKLEIREKSLFLSKPHIEVTIPLREGFFDKESVHYIITDSSNKTLVEKIAQKQVWDVRFAPKLRWAPATSLEPVYAFTNGIKGNGIYGFQDEVFSSTVTSSSYSPLRIIVAVSWKEGQKPHALTSEQDVLKAEKESRIKLEKTNVIVNAPQVAWPGGQLFVRNDTVSEIFEKGQVTKIDKDSKKVIFVAHRGWGPDGRTIYYIIPDATPVGPADIIGVPVSQKLANVLSGAAFTDMYQFKNGYKGSGELGFQASIISKLDEDYIPVCRVSVVEWKDATSATVLETVSDINEKKSDGDIYVTLARPLSEDHVVNCPIVDPGR
jgi:hypothetical protein